VTGQTYTESQIKEFAKEITYQLQGKDIGNGIVARGCKSMGRTLIYEYDVPIAWQPYDGLKKEIITGLKTADAAKLYYSNDIDIIYKYYSPDGIVNQISIKSDELGNVKLNSLGNYLSIKDHPKSKGVNLEIRAPVGWDILEGDRPNVVKKFAKDGNGYLILVTENMTFFSRKESEKILLEEDTLNQMINEYSSILEEMEVLETSVVTIDTYPALYIKAKGKKERLGLNLSIVFSSYTILYEDRIVTLQGFRIDKSKYRSLEQVFFSITNSVIFPDQYKK
jgi:hypothetical protein